MLNSPFSFATPSNCTPVATFFATTFAPGITPPELSTTVPLSDEFATPCADAPAGIAAMTAASRQTTSADLHTNRFIGFPPIHPSIERERYRIEIGRASCRERV